jgi:hypothetical protein
MSVKLTVFKKSAARGQLGANDIAYGRGVTMTPYISKLSISTGNRVKQI